MNAVYTLAVVAIGSLTLLADATPAPNEMLSLVELLSKVGVTGILLVAVWHLKNQDARKSDRIEKKDAEFIEYLKNEAEKNRVLITECRDVISQMLTELRILKEDREK